MPRYKPPQEFGPCCLCGGLYERIGNNPAPLYAGEGRCCDACNEIVTEARINPARIKEEIERVERALLRKPKDPALAAICASRGPGLWAAHKKLRAQLDEHDK